MSISFANHSEANEMAAMARMIWKEYFPTIITDEQIKYMLLKFQSEASIHEQMDGGYQYGFIFDGTEKAGYFAVLPKDDALFISKLYLYKEKRGHGLGSETLKDLLCIGRSLGLKYAYLTVNVNNALACKAYERNGFKIDKDVDTDIGEGFFMNDHIYRCEL